MAWKGVGDDQRIFFNVKLPFSQGRAWTNQQLVPGAGGTSAAPALAQLAASCIWFGMESEMIQEYSSILPLMDRTGRTSNWYQA